VLCGDDGVFTTVPTITLSFGRVNENYVPGLTLIWSEVYGEYPIEYRVTSYCGTTKLGQITVTDNNSPLSILEFEMFGYDKIVIKILRWCLPRHRARLYSCWVGLQKIYTKADLTDFSHEQSADLLSSELPKNSIVFSLDNTGGIWNPENPAGVERYLVARQTLKVKYGYLINGEMEWVKAGTFYMSEWNTPANGISATFTARDMLEMCTDIYVGITTGSLKELIEAALTQSGVDLSNVSLDASLSNTTTSLGENDSYTCAEIIQLAANAGRCIMWQDREGILRVEPLSTVLTDYIIGEMDNGLDNTYQHPEVELTKELKAVTVNEGLGGAVNSTTGVTQPVDNPLIVDADTAEAVAQWCVDCLKNRSLLSGEFRADPRLDVLDRITVVSKYSSSPLYITNIKYTYNGAFRGSFSGRVIRDE